MYQQDLALHTTVAVTTVDRSEYSNYHNMGYSKSHPKLMFRICFCTLKRKFTATESICWASCVVRFPVPEPPVQPSVVTCKTVSDAGFPAHHQNYLQDAKICKSEAICLEKLKIKKSVLSFFPSCYIQWTAGTKAALLSAHLCLSTITKLPF